MREVLGEDGAVHVAVGAVVSANVAVTYRDSSIVIAQSPVPEHEPPLHPVNVWPADGVARRVRLVWGDVA